jgi:ubiquitin-protein ligase
MFGRNKVPEKSKVNRSDRLQSDYASISSLFKAHQFISIKETFGVPPEKYLVLYKIDGLHKVGQAIEAKSEHLIEILLPPGYPDVPPSCKSISPVFHPNITADIIDIKEYWPKGATLADLIVRIGEMITFQKYSTESAINTEAAKWADRNRNILPQSSVDLSVHIPEPVAKSVPVENKRSVVEKAGNPRPGDTAVNEIIIVDQDQQEEPGPEDARKTEGFMVETDTAMLAVEQDVTFSPAPEKAIILDSKPPSETSPQEVKQPPVQPKQTDQISGMHEAPPDALPAQKAAVAPMVLFQFFYCPFCGNKNNIDANFCMACGSRLKPVKRKSPLRTISIIMMIVVPAVILFAGLAMVIVHAFNDIDKTEASRPASPSQPEPPKPEIQQQAPAVAPQAKEPAVETVTAETIEQKMMKPQQPGPKSQNVFKPGKLTDQQKKDRITGLLQNAKLYLNIGSYDDAIKRYREVLKIDPGNFEASTGVDNAEEARDKAPPRPPPSQQPEE